MQLCHHKLARRTCISNIYRIGTIPLYYYSTSIFSGSGVGSQDKQFSESIFVKYITTVLPKMPGAAIACLVRIIGMCPAFKSQGLG